MSEKVAHYITHYKSDVIGFICGIVGGNTTIALAGFYDVTHEFFYKVILGVPVSIILGMAGVFGKDIYEKYIKPKIFK